MRRFLALVFCLAAFPALAQRTCYPHKQWVDFLAREYDESRVGYGLVSDGQVAELFVSSTGTWTILRTLPSGITCQVGVGENWEILPLPEERIKGEAS